MAKNLVNSNNIEVVTSDDDLSLDFSKTVKQEIKQIEINKNNIANLKGKILWKNQNPASSITTQTLTLNSADYDVLEIFYYINGQAPSLEIISTKFIKGSGTRITTPTSSGGVIFRTITYNSNTSYNLSETQGQSVNNSLCIPLYVIGYNTGLFN